MKIEEKKVKETINLIIDGKIKISNVYFYLENTGYVQAGFINILDGGIQIIVDSPFDIENVELYSTDRLFIIE